MCRRYVLCRRPSLLTRHPPPQQESPGLAAIHVHRCDVISAEADGEDIVVRWRLSGRINLPFNPPIKPYVVTTTFERDSGMYMAAWPVCRRRVVSRFGCSVGGQSSHFCSCVLTPGPASHCCPFARHLAYPEGLLSTQRDEFAIAGWDILLHAVFPGHPFGAEPAPPVESMNI